MYKRPVTKKIEEIARIELNETPKVREETVAHILEWIQKQPHINIRTDELWLLNFIRGCKFSTQKTKQKIETYLKAKELVPEVFTNRDPFSPPLQEMLQKGCIIPFGTPDMECVIVRWEVFDPNKVCFADIMKMALMFLDIFMSESETCMALGHYAIIDFKGLPLAFLPQFTPFKLHRYLYNLLLAYPSRLKSIYLINCLPGIETVFNVTKHLLGDKLTSRVSFYGENLSQIYESIPKKYFPNEYGGCAGSIDELADIWKRKFESYGQWFLDDSKCFLGNVKDASVIHGKNPVNDVDGSFRKLEFD